jgi:hypothetical protein
VDHHVEPLTEDVQIGIGDEYGDLDQRVLAEIEPGQSIQTRRSATSTDYAQLGSTRLNAAAGADR